jgi:hypothetical protein
MLEIRPAGVADHERMGPEQEQFKIIRRLYQPKTAVACDSSVRPEGGGMKESASTDRTDH